MSSAPIAEWATRPARKARRYSTTWKRATQLPGTRTSVTRPPSTLQPLTTRMMPPTPSVSGDSRNGRTAWLSAFGSSSESASIRQIERIAGGVDAGVERVGPAAVLLVDQHELGVGQRTVDGRGPSPSGSPIRSPSAPRPGRRPRCAPRSVSSLEPSLTQITSNCGIVQEQQRAHALDNRRLLVVGRRDDADRRASPATAPPPRARASSSDGGAGAAGRRPATEHTRYEVLMARK